MNLNEITINELLNMDDAILVDVRSPGEENLRSRLFQGPLIFLSLQMKKEKK